jgi:predicted ArsR family transcriptional regulator
MDIVSGILVGTIALAVLSLLGYLGHAAIDRADRAGDARVAEATAKGELAVANQKIETANASIAQIDDARKRQQVRADALEKELEDAETNPVVPGDPDRPGRARLLAALRSAAGYPSAAANQGDHGSGSGGVPDAAAAGAVGAGKGGSGS